MNIVESEDQFEFIRKDSNALVVYFCATWCVPCKALAPTLEALVAEYPTVNFVKVDVDAVPKIPTAFGIRGIPTILFFRDGKVVGQTVGAVKKTPLIEAIRRLL